MSRGGVIANVVIIGAILMFVVILLIPGYQGYHRRDQMTEVVAAAGACKTAVAEYVARERTWPAGARQAGCPAASSRYVAEVRVSGGRIDAIIKGLDPLVDGKAVVFEATRDAETTRRAKAGETIEGWHCSTTAGREAFKFLPANCRQNPLPP